MDEVERLEEQRVQAAHAVKKLSLIRDRAHANIAELEGMKTNSSRRSELLQKCEDVAHLLDAELREAREWLQDTEADLANQLRERRGK